MKRSRKMQKKLAVISAMAGYGRASITVTLPIVSYLGVQCCPVPTSILSNNTGFPHFFFDDYTDRMPQYIENWKKLGISFDGIATGFLGSARQIQIVKEFIRDFSKEGMHIIIDPVMGDHGRLYSTYTEEMCQEMKQLVSLASITTPNLTECCKLTDTPFKETGWKKKELFQMAEKLSELGPQKIVITGIPQGEFIANYIYEKGKEPKWIRAQKVGTERCGTGDVFSAIIAADSINEVPFDKSVKKASGFVKKCILKSMEMEIPKTDGVCFEEILFQLKRK
ncbi:MAG: pyridoxamine kinase [Lachnospiraceae bacterium]|nr:pyridoxamine kinase [Lachnospiraceae bacterium]